MMNSKNKARVANDLVRQVAQVIASALLVIAAVSRIKMTIGEMKTMN